jgi:prophage regulatory protein
MRLSKMKQALSNPTPDRIISLAEMAHLLNRHKKTVWRLWAKDGALPAPLMMNNRTLGWKESTYNAWLAEKAGV